MIFAGFLVVILIGVFVVVYNTSQESDCCDAGVSKEQKVFFLINYGENETGVAEKLSDGSYRLQDGTAISRDDAEVIESYEDQTGYYCCPMDPVCGTDGNTYMSICAAALPMSEWHMQGFAVNANASHAMNVSNPSQN